MNEYVKIYKNNFPYIYREEETTINIINKDDNNYIERRNDNNELIGLSIINKNTILLLCVASEYRNKGIGSSLLEESEKLIKDNGYDEVILGVGFNYLMPGIPTTNHYFNSEHEELYPSISDEAEKFFLKRGYKNTSTCDYFDMGLYLKDYNYDEIKIGDTIDGIEYRFASINDIDDICVCTDDAEKNFTKYYRLESNYINNHRVIIAVINNEVVGTMMLGIETEGNNVGDLAVATTKHAYRNRHISSNLTRIATQYLKDNNIDYAHLNYTYTGLDHVYGYAGYKICVYYIKASKEI